MTAGDGLAAADVGAFVLAWTAAGSLEEVPALGWAACWACVAWEPVGWAGWACAAWEPVKVSSMTLTAVTAHTATAMVAIAAPGWVRMLAQLTRLIACENSAAHLDSARRTTRRR